MPAPIRIASAGASLALAAAPIPLPAWNHGAKADHGLDHRVHRTAPGRQWTAAQRPSVGHDIRVKLKVSPRPKRALKPQGVTDARARHHSGPRAHAAGDPANTISDFKFTPGTTTIHVGDAITWTNSGPSPHTATASDGSFDTGTLAKGASASHTFTHSGTFAYICKIHPFMKGTVVVLAAASTPPAAAQTPTTAQAGSTTPASSTPAPASAPAQSQTPTLPVTGISVPSILTVALSLLALGWLLRGSARATDQARRRPHAGAREP